MIDRWMFDDSNRFNRSIIEEGDCYVKDTRFFIPIFHCTHSDSTHSINYWKAKTIEHKGTYPRIFRNLKDANHKVEMPRQDVTIVVSRGVVFDMQDNIHFLITSNRISELGWRKFRVYLSKEFVDPKSVFKNIYRKFYTDILADALEEGVQICIVDNIKNLYTDKLNPLQFDDFEDQLNHFNSAFRIVVPYNEEE